MRNTLILFACCIRFLVSANDGAYFASGNHLIPIMETDIAVKKEILTVKKVRNQFIEVTVYYEFFNPGKEKEVLVGFEAGSPSGDVDGRPKKGLHPYMRDFTVSFNDRILDYKVAYVSDSLYVRNGAIKSKTLVEVEAGIQDENNVAFYYVYHFTAHFKKGLNIVRHTYNYDVSGGIEYNFDFMYILTAANRWANKQIDDFTLIVDMGEFEVFDIDKWFFTSADEWIINGIGKSGAADPSPYEEGPANAVKFTVQKGNLVFQKSNFHPAGELRIYARNHHYSEELFNQEMILPFSYNQQDRIPEAVSETEKRILKNLPFARRGYIFSNKEIGDYYKRMDWYIPNPNYQPVVELLTEQEKAWIRKWN